MAGTLPPNTHPKAEIGAGEQRAGSNLGGGRGLDEKVVKWCSEGLWEMQRAFPDGEDEKDPHPGHP